MSYPNFFFMANIPQTFLSLEKLLLCSSMFRFLFMLHFIPWAQAQGIQNETTKWNDLIMHYFKTQARVSKISITDSA